MELIYKPYDDTIPIEYRHSYRPQRILQSSQYADYSPVFVSQSLESSDRERERERYVIDIDQRGGGGGTKP